MIFKPDSDKSSDEELEFGINSVALEQHSCYYSDDFLREISLVSLIYFKERNDKEIKSAITVYINSKLFNHRHSYHFVGCKFTSEDVKKLVRKLKKRRATYSRRLM